MSNARDFDNTQAHTEGWAIFDCDGSANGRWQICKIDCPAEWNEAYEEGDPNRLPFEDAQFNNDGEVWALVATKALDGSAYHLAALAYIRKHNPKEWASIILENPKLKPRIRVPAITRKAA